MKKKLPILQIRELDEHWKKRVSAPSVDMKLVKFSFLSKAVKNPQVDPSCLLRDLGFCLGLNHFHHEKLVNLIFVERYLKFKPLAYMPWRCACHALNVFFRFQRSFLQPESA